MKALLEQIARKNLGIKTLATRNSDSLDFHDCGVAGLKAALEAAYSAGFEAAYAECTGESPELPTCGECGWVASAGHPSDQACPGCGEPMPTVPDADACAGCGCLPGDGITPGCMHPEGCGSTAWGAA